MRMEKKYLITMKTHSKNYTPKSLFDEIINQNIYKRFPVYWSKTLWYIFGFVFHTRIISYISAFGLPQLHHMGP